MEHLELYEDFTQNTQKNFDITFDSNFGFISDNTLDASIQAIKKEDPTVKERYDRGKGQKNIRLLYLKSSLESKDIRIILNKFIQKYDQLKFQVTTMAK